MTANSTLQQGIVHILPIIVLGIVVVGLVATVNLVQQSQNVSSKAATGYPTGFQERQMISGLSEPTRFALAPDGRLFILQKGGRVRLYKNGSLVTAPFMDVSVNTFFERGLLGIAFDPNFTTNRFIYIYYTRTTNPLKNRVSRFTASSTNPDIVEAGSEVILLDNIASDAGNHNGGDLVFGQDGKLYISTGDGGSNSSNSQMLSNLSGKILRINKDGTVPPDNPFIGVTDPSNGQPARGEIWVYGLRNPYSFAMDPSDGKMFINDVGAGAVEEINLLQKGTNYGWPTCEGSCNRTGFTNPIYEYGRNIGGAIIGGVFYRGSQFPSLYQGKYFFGDYVSSWIRYLDPATRQPTLFASDAGGPVDYLVTPDGALWYLSIYSGTATAITFGQQSPSPTATSTRTPTPMPSATATPIPTATATPIPNRTPTAAIVTPSQSTTYSAGDTITFGGTGTDPDDGTLAAAAFAWRIVFHHDTHTHPFLSSIPGVTNGTFTIPQVGETSANVWYRIYLQVTDTKGATNEVFRDVLPRKATITLATNPSALEVTIDGQPRTAPFSEQNIVGMLRMIGVTSPQEIQQFSSWSDGGAREHQITIPATNAIYTALFVSPTNTPTPTTPPTTTPVPTPSNTPLPVSAPWVGQYFRGRFLSGTPRFTRNDTAINFNWGWASLGNGIGRNTFSARWTKDAFFETGTYRFSLRHDDGMRVWVDNQLVYDIWRDQAPVTRILTLPFTTGIHTVRVDYYENRGRAQAVVSWIKQ